MNRAETGTTSPCVAALDCQELHAAVRAGLASGLSAAAAAERFGVSRQHVYRIAKK